MHWLKKFICIFFPNSFHSWKKTKIIFSHQNFCVENSYFLPLQSMYQQQDWRSFDCKWSSILPKYALIQSLFIFFTSVRPFYPQRILMTTSDRLGTKKWVSGIKSIHIQGRNTNSFSYLMIKKNAQLRKIHFF